MTLWQTLLGWALTCVSFVEDKIVHANQQNAVVTGTTMSLYALICQERGAFGPSLTTGGIIHKITDAQAAQVSTALWNECKKLWPSEPEFAAGLAMLAAWIRGESRFDPNAYNPNNQDIPKGTTQTAEQIFMHTDIGWGQFDGTELGPMLPGLTWQQQMAKAYDITWACPAHAQWATGLVEWAMAQTAIMQKVNDVLSPDAHILAFEAYNAGKSGALARALLDMGGTKVPLAIHDGALVAQDKATADDLSFTDKLMASIAGPSTMGLGHGLVAAPVSNTTLMGYGNGLNATWSKYKALLGTSPTLGC